MALSLFIRWVTLSHSEVYTRRHHGHPKDCDSKVTIHQQSFPYVENDDMIFYRPCLYQENILEKRGFISWTSWTSPRQHHTIFIYDFVWKKVPTSTGGLGGVRTRGQYTDEQTKWHTETETTSRVSDRRIWIQIPKTTLIDGTFKI